MRKDILWNSLGTAAWSFISLFLLIIVTRINGIQDSGLFSFAFAFALIMYTVACYGGRTYQVSDHNNQFAANNYISVRLLTSSAVILVTILFVLINDYDWQKALLIFLLVGHRMFDAIADVLYGILQKGDKLFISGKSLFYKSLLSLIVFLALDMSTKNVLLSATALPVISLLFVLLYDVPQSMKLENIKLRFVHADIKKILKSTFLPFAITLMGLIFVNIARYFVDLFHPELQGYFGIIIMPLSLVILLFSFILTPALLRLTYKYNAGDFAELNRTVLNIIGITAAASFTIGTMAYFIGAPLLHVLFGISFDRYVIDIVMVVLIGFTISLSSLFTNIAIIARGLRVTAVVYLLTVILITLLCIVLVNKYRIRGAIIAYVIASIVQALVMGSYYRYLTASHISSRNS